MSVGDTPELPFFASWPSFPFEGDIRVKPIAPLDEIDPVRSGEPGGPPCTACPAPDEGYIWVSDNWRVKGFGQPAGVPVLLFLEPRAHVDMDGLDDSMAAEFGQMIVRIDRAVQAIGDVGRVHVSRWGDGAEHLHLWIYARPRGNAQMLGLFMPIWAAIYPPTPQDVWDRNLKIVAAELARTGGRSMLT